MLMRASGMAIGLTVYVATGVQLREVAEKIGWLACPVRAKQRPEHPPPLLLHGFGQQRILLVKSHFQSHGCSYRHRLIRADGNELVQRYEAEHVNAYKAGLQ